MIADYAFHITECRKDIIMLEDKHGRFIRDFFPSPPFPKGYRAAIVDIITRRYPNAKPNWETRGEVLAEVGNGCWRVRCPHCPGAQVISQGEPFFCVDCMMIPNEGYSMAVVWPENRRDIEAVLLARPLVGNMNFLPGRKETITTLQLENLEHGCLPCIEGYKYGME
jgi:hypothetical protein